MSGGLYLSSILPLTPIYLLFVLAYLAAGLYPGFGLTALEEFRRAVLASATVSLGLGAVLFLSRSTDYSRLVFILSVLFVVGLVPIFRSLLRGWAMRRRWWGYPVVVIGPRKKAAALVRGHPRLVGWERSRRMAPGRFDVDHARAEVGE